MKSFTLYPIGTVKAEGETAALQLDAAYIPGLDGLEGPYTAHSTPFFRWV